LNSHRITDEFTPDLEPALDAMAAIGMTGAELRVVWGKNIMDLTDDEVKRAMDLINARNMHVLSIASPMLKCVLPGGPDVDTRFQQDVFASKHTFRNPARADGARPPTDRDDRRQDHPRLQLLAYGGTRQNAWTPCARPCTRLADQAKPHNVIIGIENEHACNVGTAAEAKVILDAVQHPNLQLVWDPANMLVAGEDPFPARLRHPAQEPHRPRPRQGLPHGRPHAHLGPRRHPPRRLEGPDRRAAARWLHRRGQPRNPLAGPEQQQVRGQCHLRLESARSAGRLIPPFLYATLAAPPGGAPFSFPP
jgi:sugar phosphate isomerase/epimerase